VTGAIAGTAVAHGRRARGRARHGKTSAPEQGTRDREEVTRASRDKREDKGKTAGRRRNYEQAATARSTLTQRRRHEPIHLSLSSWSLVTCRPCDSFLVPCPLFYRSLGSSR
jgi:hypothetical protein